LTRRRVFISFQDITYSKYHIQKLEKTARKSFHQPILAMHLAETPFYENKTPKEFAQSAEEFFLSPFYFQDCNELICLSVKEC